MDILNSRICKKAWDLVRIGLIDGWMDRLPGRLVEALEGRILLKRRTVLGSGSDTESGIRRTSRS